MRDIKQYFMNGMKSDKKEITDGNNHVKQEEDQQRTAEKGICKRKRVKIRISRVDSKERTCDIIESKNDLIDKTPSPFAKKNNKYVQQDETPKSTFTCSSTERNSKDFKLSLEINEDKSNKVNISQNRKSNEDKDKLNNAIVDLNENDSSDDDHSIRSVNDESPLNTKFQHDIGSQREESNAFQVLMNRDKPIQYKLSMQQLVEDIKCDEKSNDVKELRAKYKKQLITLADKKGYTKRKFMEAEEGERIEMNIANRTNFYKNQSDKDVTTQLMIKNKRPSGKLFDYLSKSPVELMNKDMQCVSTFIIKADVHRSDTAASIEPILKPVSNKIYSSKCSKVDWDHLTKVDDIHIVESENLISPQTAKQNKNQKSRWSLRIKLQSSEDHDGQNDNIDDELFPSRSTSKYDSSHNIFRKYTNTCIESYKKNRLKRHSEHIETKVQRKERNESLDKQKRSSVQMNVIKNNTIKDNDKDFSEVRTRKSDKMNKVEETFHNTSEMFITVAVNDSDCKIISENIRENVLKRKSDDLPEKLAPLFVKQRKTDPIIAAARRLFLRSDIIDLENKSANENINSHYTSIFPFPTISHITQLKNELYFSIKHKFPIKIEEEYLPTIDNNEYKYIINHSMVLKTTKTADSPVKGNFSQVLSEFEECSDMQRMWEIVSTIKNKTEKESQPRLRGGKRTRSLDRKELVMKNAEESQLHDCVWTCKYKPMSAQEIVGNEEAAMKLKDWLNGWRLSSTTKDYSSGDEFYSSDSSNISRNNEIDHIAVLLGPHGSGKSASVYAIAEELGYSILEVNASSRRTGKRISKELEEATKSHRVKKELTLEQIVKESETRKISRNSLILLEDIDLIFEEDEGFISAAYQLASNTKRPIVMTCRDTCLHLSKMAPQLKKIHFQKVNGNRALALLKLISLAETGYNLPQSYLIKLLQAGDLRKALLQLQYLLLSGLPIMPEQSSDVLIPSLWQNAQHSLYLSAIKLNRKCKVKKNANSKKLNKWDDVVYDTLHDLAVNLDNLSIVSLLIDIDDMALNVPETNAQPNLSLAENLSLYSASCQLSVDLANFISDRTVYKNLNGYEYAQNQMNVVLRRQLNQRVDLALSHITSICLDRRVMATDYIPTARTICRAEESRSMLNHKRGNRFFHYLHGLKMPAASMKPNILTAACRTLQEKVAKSALVIGHS